MSTFKSLAVLLAAAASAIAAAPVHAEDPPHPAVAAIFNKALADMPGKEALMLLVEYPPGGADPIHKHDAHAFVYVIEGSIVMQVKGGPEVTLTPGQTFYEAPSDIHTVGRNASTTKPAKFVVVLIKNQGVDALMPVNL